MQSFIDFFFNNKAAGERSQVPQSVRPSVKRQTFIT